METWLYSIPAGVVLMIAGIALQWWHHQVWEEQKQNAELEEEERDFLQAQYRRRRLASGLLTVLGLLIPVGDVLIPWVQFPTAFALYWGFAILLAFWVIVLGLLDVRATTLHSRVTFERIRREQRSLEQELAEIRRRHSNGQDTSHDSR